MTLWSYTNLTDSATRALGAPQAVHPRNLPASWFGVFALLFKSWGKSASRTRVAVWRFWGVGWSAIRTPLALPEPADVQPQLEMRCARPFVHLPT